MNKTESELFFATNEWIAKYLGAKAGILVIENIENNDINGKLSEHRVEVETIFREKFHGFSRESLDSIPVIEAYNRYYKDFGKTYHVRSQVESIIGGKSLSSSSPILTAMFMAEVENMLMTAGHDLDKLNLPVCIRIATGNEYYEDIRGSNKKTMAGDMIMADRAGIVSSIILGPDSRTKITPRTRNVLFAVYAPSEISKESVLAHLQDIEKSIKLFAPDSKTKLIKVFEAK